METFFSCGDPNFKCMRVCTLIFSVFFSCHCFLYFLIGKKILNFWNLLFPNTDLPHFTLNPFKMITFCIVSVYCLINRSTLIMDTGNYYFVGRLAFHGKHWVGSYHDQKEETQPYIDWFVKERLPKWLKHFELVLKNNNGGNG